MGTLRKKHPVAMFCAWFLMVFLVLFPKGGGKMGGVPLTWGYLFLAVSAPPVLLVRLLAMPLRIPMRLLAALSMLLPMQILYVYAGLVNGIASPAYAVSTFSAFFLLPIIFLLVYAPFLQYVDGERLRRYFTLCVFFAAVWGIFLFVWHPITGKFIEVPYLTVNAADAGDLEYTKHISRGLFLKLISTYNNGNLYGVCTLILLPLYNLLEPKRWRRVLLRVALLLTLSRTVWAGLILEQALSVGVLLSGQLNTFPRLYLGKAAKRVGALAITIGLVFLSLIFNSASIAFLFDSQLGGRRGFYAQLFHPTFLPSEGLNAFTEVAYAAAATEFGLTGLLAFTLLMLSPVLLLFVDSSALKSPSRRAALKGLILYTFLAGIDSGLSYLPTMAFYWFVYMIYIFGWPAAHRLLVAHRTPAAGTSTGAVGLQGEAAQA